MASEVVGGVTQQRPIFQGARASLERKRLGPAEHIRPGYFEDYAWAFGDHSGVGIATLLRRILGIRAATRAYLLHFESHAIADGVAFPLLQIHHHSFIWIGGGWILGLYLNAAEYAEIVEPGWCFYDVALSQRTLWFDFDL